MRIRLLLSLALWLAAAPVQATVIARVVAPATVQVGSFFDVELRASLPDPILGWGLDLSADPLLVQRSGAASISSSWIAFAAPDGDGLAGVYLPPPQGMGITGSDVLLAVVHYQALSIGDADFQVSDTSTDLTEGFALDPEGFAQVQYQGARVSIAPVPEPGTAALLLGGFASLAAARRRARPRGQGPARG